MATKEKEVKSVVQPTTTPENISSDDVLENLKTQYQEFSAKAEENKVMALKALGAIEVLTGLKENKIKE
jgi:hypothetical protein